MEVMIEYGFYFMIYGFLGWIVEVIFTGIGNRHFVNRGFLFLPFLPLYAFGAVFLIITLSGYINNILLLYVFGVISTTFIEYVAALFLENVFHVKWWDYSKYKYNFQGRVCLRNSLLFGFLALFLMLVIHPPIHNFITSLNPEYSKFIVDTFLIAIIIDLYFTLRKLGKMSVRNMESINKHKSEEIVVPDLINGKYTSDKISNAGINIILTISVLIGFVLLFLIDLQFALTIIIILFISMYGVFKNKKRKRKIVGG